MREGALLLRTFKTRYLSCCAVAADDVQVLLRLVDDEFFQAGAGRLAGEVHVLCLLFLACGAVALLLAFCRAVLSSRVRRSGASVWRHLCRDFAPSNSPYRRSCVSAQLCFGKAETASACNTLARTARAS